LVYYFAQTMTTFIKNRKATFDFEHLDTFEAGAVLTGHEVKSIRAGKGKLEGSYVMIINGEAFLLGASISPFQPANTPKSYNPEQPRKLLLSKKQLAKLEVETRANRLTIVPISWYSSKQLIKLKIALARGKKKTDKRETIKARDNKREIDRTLKSQ
jgi:SsrA-binding protein